jgi:filamentous hemagglutinin
MAQVCPLLAIVSRQLNLRVFIVFNLVVCLITVPRTILADLTLKKGSFGGGMTISGPGTVTIAGAVTFGAPMPTPIDEKQEDYGDIESYADSSYKGDSAAIWSNGKLHMKDAEIESSDDLTMQARVVHLENSKFKVKGNLDINAENVLLTAGRKVERLTHTEKKSGGLFGLSKRKSVHEEHHDVGIPTEIDVTGSFTVNALNAIVTEGADIRAHQGIYFNARQWVNWAFQDIHCVSDEVKRSGLFKSSHKVSGHCKTDIIHTHLNPGEGSLVLEVDHVEAMVGLDPSQSLEQAQDKLVERYPDLAWITALRDHGDVHWHTIQNAYEDWYQKSSGLSPLAAVIVSTAVAVATGTMGASFLPASMSTNLIATNAANAAFSSLVAKTAVDLGNNNGNLGKTVKNLLSEDTVKNVAVDVVAAGLMGATKTPYRISPSASLAQRIQEYGVRIASRAGASFTVSGGSLVGHLKDGLSEQTWQEVGAQANYWAGNYAQVHGWDEGNPQKVALHASVGAVLGELKGGKPLAGALAAGSAQIVAGLTEDQSLEVQEATVTIIAAITANIVGGDPQDGAWIGLTQQQYNRELHLKEAETLQNLMENAGDEETRARFIAAACAIVHCSRGIGADDTDVYNTFVTLEQAGDSYVKEREALLASGAFQYTTKDRLDDVISHHHVGITQFAGILQASRGVLDMVGSFAGGAMLCMSGIGCGIGAAVTSVGSTLGLNDYMEGVQKLTTYTMSDSAERVASSFHPDTHLGEHSHIEELGRSVFIAAVEHTVGRLGLKLIHPHVHIAPHSSNRGLSDSDNIEKLGIDVWNLDAKERGREIEKYLAKTEYKNWQPTDEFINPKTGKQFKSRNFPLIDFQLQERVVSLKTVDTKGSTWDYRMRKHIDELESREITVSSVPAIKVLDIRCQPGGLNDAQHLIQYGKERNIEVIIKEFGN